MVVGHKKCRKQNNKDNLLNQISQGTEKFIKYYRQIPFELAFPVKEHHTK